MSIYCYVPAISVYTAIISFTIYLLNLRGLTPTILQESVYNVYMPRKIIPLITGEVYHVFNRGVDKREIFHDKADYIRFYQSMYLFNTVEPILNYSHALTLVIDDPKDRLVRVHAFSLLPNHYHLLIEQLSEGGISEFVKRVSGGFTSYFNEKYDRSGALFQGRFKRVHVTTDEQYKYVFAYVNENHIVHMTQRPDDICYSSSSYFQGHQQSKLIDLKTSYNVEKSQELAKDIYQRRQREKSIIE